MLLFLMWLTITIMMWFGIRLPLVMLYVVSYDDVILQALQAQQRPWRCGQEAPALRGGRPGRQQEEKINNFIRRMN